MIDRDSRYAGLNTTSVIGPDGQRLLYLSRRILPEGQSLPSVRQVEVTSGSERLDLISHMVFGDAFAFWRLCDANDALNPFDLIEERERRLRIPSGIS